MPLFAAAAVKFKDFGIPIGIGVSNDDKPAVLRHSERAAGDIQIVSQDLIPEDLSL